VVAVLGAVPPTCWLDTFTVVVVVNDEKSTEFPVPFPMNVAGAVPATNLFLVPAPENTYGPAAPPTNTFGDAAEALPDPVTAVTPDRVSDPAAHDTVHPVLTPVQPEDDRLAVTPEAAVVKSAESSAPLPAVRAFPTKV
jgi:hypothetical protein